MIRSHADRKSALTQLFAGLLGIGLATSAVDSALAQASGTWTTTGSLNVARSAHTATLLPNGLVLVAGGEDASSKALSSAELYDPASGRWSLTGSLSTPRYSHTATLLPDGQVLVVGGLNPIYLDSAELYNPSTGQWNTTGSMATPRSSHGVALLENGQVLVAGGYSFGTGTATAELYDPAKGTWRSTASMIHSAVGQATRLQNGQVLVPDGSHYISAQLYDPSPGTWSLTSTMVFTQSNTTNVLLPSGDVLIFGSANSTTYDSEFYDPSTNVWTRTFGQNYGNMLSGPMTLLQSGKALIAGGPGNYRSLVRNAMLYDASTNRWTLTGSLNQFRRNHTLTLLQNGQALAAGGASRNSSGTTIVISSAELYTP
jgi:N-acetylneuraminic acid mutarotase